MEDTPIAPLPADEPVEERPVDGAAKRARAMVWSTLSWVRDLAFSVLVAVLLIVFIYQPVKVEGTSMEPALDDQERIFINKFTYSFGLGSIARGDTVVFEYPHDPEKLYIKRVIGIPGDRIRIVTGQVFVNGHALVEDYVPQWCRDSVSWPLTAVGETPDEREVPKECYFVLGDHRSSSSDSRSWGWVPRANIHGKAVFIYWPLDKMGRLH
jgi:signal peptidase I